MLTGAETDAKVIFETLMEPQIGDYDQARSGLLLSPTLLEVRDALTTVLFSEEPLDTLTIAFAGHGAVSAGSFYMATRDSRLEALSATALPLADLFRMIAEAAPKQTYLFIDACQSGALISDLNVILKSEVMGEFGSPGLTLLATAASNEVATEVGGHGIGTTALLDCIRGDTFIQDSNPALDLVEIGRAVSERVSAVEQQTPVVWGLNLYGPSSFCRNPHAQNGNAPLRSVLAGWPDVGTAPAIRASLRQLWEPYITIPNRWNARVFVDRVASLLGEVRTDPAALINMAHRISEACSAQADDSRDRFRRVEVKAACSVAMLPFAADARIAAHLESECTEISVLVEDAIDHVVEAIKKYEYALVTGGMGDLYYLPIRLTKLLGWAGFTVHSRLALERDSGIAATKLAELFARISKTYSLSLVAMSDSQSPYVISALTALARVGLNEEGEQLLGHMFSSSVNCGGRVARGDIDPSKVLGYLVARYNGQLKPSTEMVAQPTELVLALLRASRLFDLTDEFDAALDQLDHLALNAYLPEDYTEFGAEQIPGGRNAVFQVGHDVWSVSDLESVWPNFPSPEDGGPRLAALLASLLFPDRSPWFLLPVPLLIEGNRNIPEQH
nr:caspase family protein [Croceibacterium sp. D39]